MKVIKNIALAAMLGFCAVSGASAADLKIGVIDVRELVANSPKAKAIGDKLKAEFKGKEAKLIGHDKMYQEKMAKLKKDEAILSKAERSKLEKELNSLVREMQKEQMELQEKAGMRQQQEMGKFLDEVKAVVTKLAQEGKYDMVIQSEALPYVNPKMDITKEVMARMAK